jgi:hypothetical protein
MVRNLERALETFYFSLSHTRNVFPVNVVQATLQSYRTVLIPPENDTSIPMKDWEIGEIKFIF